MRTAKAIEMVSIKSKTPDGRGTIIMAKIAITKRTTLKSLLPKRKLSVVPTCCLVVSFFANETIPLKCQPR